MKPSSSASSSKGAKPSREQPGKDSVRARGALNLAFELVDGATELVEKTHRDAVRRTYRKGARIGLTDQAPDQTPIAGLIFGAIKSVSRIAKQGTLACADAADHLLPAPAPRSDAPPTDESTDRWRPRFDYAEAVVNGLVGDYLSQRENALDLGMSVRHRGKPLPLDRRSVAEAFPDARPRIGIYIHGLGVTESLWNLASERHYGESGVNFGTRLEEDLGLTPIHVRYNSGRRIAENGQALSDLIEEVVSVYPVPVEEICLIGHSLGGLVARSAAHHAEEQGASWRNRLRHVVCIGSPHHGSPYARAVDGLAAALRTIDAAAPQVVAEVLESRSEGIADLRRGDIAKPGVPTEQGVPGVRYHFVAATVTQDPWHPMAHLLGDLLVRLPSASGQGSGKTPPITVHSGQVFPGLNHFELTNHPRVYQTVREQLGAPITGTQTETSPSSDPDPKNPGAT